MAPVAIVLLLALAAYLYFGVNVGKARAKHGVKAPSTTGDPEFERCFRVQQNTLENLIVFVPAIWLFGLYINPIGAAGIGIIFIIGRLMYSAGYRAAAEKRGPGFGVSFLANAALVIGALIGAVWEIL